ncbi:hypothetical protein [Pseudonocardia oceani]|uniref:hypothetical protein n=1 Tax=Pseudonocardia oceani TaxID=2792013 RepID=UPI001C49E210|nr:hypothetical protein [Pseudonocardia oceani]
MIATVDLRGPDPAAVDTGLQEAGFLLVTGHGVWSPGTASTWHCVPSCGRRRGGSSRCRRR